MSKGLHRMAIASLHASMHNHFNLERHLATAASIGDELSSSDSTELGPSTDDDAL